MRNVRRSRPGQEAKCLCLGGQRVFGRDWIVGCSLGGRFTLRTLLTWGFGRRWPRTPLPAPCSAACPCGCCESRTTLFIAGREVYRSSRSGHCRFGGAAHLGRAALQPGAWYRPAIDRRAHAAQRRCTRPHVPDCRRKFPTIWSRSADDRLAHPARGLACPVSFVLGRQRPRHLGSWACF